MDKFTNKTIEKLKYDLVREGLISYEQLENAQDIAKVQSINVAQALIKMKLLTDSNEDYLEAILILKIKNGSYDESKAKKIALWNSIIVGGIYPPPQ